MNTPAILNFQTPKTTSIPHRGAPIRTALDLLVTLAAVAAMAAVLLFSL